MKSWKVLPFILTATLLFTGCESLSTVKENVDTATREVMTKAIVDTTKLMTGDLELGGTAEAEPMPQGECPYGFILGYTFTEEAGSLNNFMAVTGMAVNTVLESGTTSYIHKKKDIVINLYVDNEVYDGEGTDWEIYGYEIWGDETSLADADFYFDTVRLNEGCINDILARYGDPRSTKTYLAEDDTIRKVYGWCSEHSDSPNLWFYINESGEVYGVTYRIPNAPTY